MVIKSQINEIFKQCVLLTFFVGESLISNHSSAASKRQAPQYISDNVSSFWHIFATLRPRS